MKSIVFDMDGVILDSERIASGIWHELAAEYGLTDMDEVYPLCIGVTKTVSAGIFAERYGKDFPYGEFIGKSAERFRAYYQENGMPLKKGVVSLLDFLREEGYQIALASSTAQEKVRTQLGEAGVLSYFDAVICGDMLKKSKPEPDIYLLACRSLGVSPKDAYAVEDSYNGIRSAYRAGMRALMVPDMLPPTEEMERLAYRILPDLDAVREFLRKEG